MLQGGRDRGRGRGRGRRGRRGRDDEEDSGMTLDEYEAMQRKPKPAMPAGHPLGTMKLVHKTQHSGYNLFFWQSFREVTRHQFGFWEAGLRQQY